eukprot:1507193-Alexandrium_andersonii.AAC.1
MTVVGPPAGTGAQPLAWQTTPPWAAQAAATRAAAHDGQGPIWPPRLRGVPSEALAPLVPVDWPQAEATATLAHLVRPGYQAADCSRDGVASAARRGSAASELIAAASATYTSERECPFLSGKGVA